MNTHPFEKHPNRTLIALSIPVLLSLTAEPITALVDTAFISSLGEIPLAALGVGTTALTSIFWIFNFLGIGTQTEVAQEHGKGSSEKTGKITSLALAMALLVGIVMIMLLFPLSGWLAGILGAEGQVQTNAVDYMQIRLFGAPAVLSILVIFGAMRGLQDMKTPLWIALGINILNLLLDWLLIFGNGPFPVMGVKGSALASTISQWLGALAGFWIISRQVQLTKSVSLADGIRLMRIGGDLFIRTALLNLFLAYTTRAANQLGAEAGAAHQVIRQVYVFTALALDAFSSTVQSLVGYFIGREAIEQVRKVIRIGLAWSIGTGLVLAAVMWFGKDLVIGWLVPAASVSVFIPAWAASALTQPFSAVSFLTDGALWGTNDFKFLRNAMLLASAVGVLGLWLLEHSSFNDLWGIWAMTAIWVIFRGAAGLWKSYRY